MQGRLSHVLVAVVAVGVTVGVYTTWNAINETFAAVDSVVPTAPVAGKASSRKADVVSPKSKTNREPIQVPIDPKTGEAIKAPERRERASKDERTERLAGRAGELGVSLPELREYRLGKKAEEKGVSADELREKRQDKKANQDEVRREKRAEWRANQDIDELRARKEAKREQMSPEEEAARAERKQYREDVVEAYPSVGDAAKVLQQLRVMGQAGQEPQ